MSVKQKQARVEEDVDELDDFIDQFSPQPSASTSSAPEPAATATEDTDKGADGTTEQERLAAAWEAMLLECMNGMHDPSTSAPSPRPGDAFQSSIRSTMNRRREGEPGLRTPESSADPLESLFARLGVDPAGEDPEMEKELLDALESMMGGLMSKEVLYEPLKELHEKFPGYLDKNAGKLSPSDEKRFKAQMACIEQLIKAFDDPSYRDDDEQSNKRIVDLMSELQSHGSPPEEVMGPLPPGFNADECVCT